MLVKRRNQLLRNRHRGMWKRQALFVMVKKKLTASIGVATILVNKFDPKKRIFTGLTLVFGISNLSPAGTSTNCKKKLSISTNFRRSEFLCVFDPNSVLLDEHFKCVSKLELESLKV